MDEKKPCKFCERLKWWKEHEPKVILIYIPPTK